MTTQRTLALAVALLLTIIALAAGVAVAQEPAGTEPAGAEPAAALAALGTSFTYQGRLTDGGSPANGLYGFEFRLYDALSGGVQAGSGVTQNDVTVTDGLFTVQLDFGNVFDGAALYLDIGVRPGASGDAYTALSPRQPLTAAPYALYALNTADHDHWGETWTGGGMTGSGLSVMHTATSGLTYGVYGQNASSNGAGVAGSAVATSGSAYGVYGLSASTTGSGVYGYANATSGANYGVYGRSASTEGSGVFGAAYDSSGTNYGVYGYSDSSAGHGVFGVAGAATGANYGVYGRSYSTAGLGVYGMASADSGITGGVYGRSNSTSGRGVFGWATATSGSTYGVLGQSDSPDGRGVYGLAVADSGAAYGLYGLSASTEGRGVYGFANAVSGTTYGMYGQSNSTAGRGVYGFANAVSGTTYGVYGQSNSTAGTGVVGRTTAASGNTIGVYGQSDSASGYAGYFNGRVHVAGTLSKAAGSFKIDHPLDPANKYLSHSFVESPDMMNVYNGNVMLDEQGEAWVDLPDWFEALNRDFRYQLTPIGGPGPNLYVAQKVQGNRFQIAGGAPDMEVSWQVTGIRQDAYANAHRIPVEEAKLEDERGLYLHPTELGQPKERGLDYQRDSALREMDTAGQTLGEGGSQ